MVSEFDRRDIAFDDRVEAGKELARRIIVAVPVGSLQACRDLEGEADEVICARLPRDFIAVGKWYLDFSETADAEVIRLLQPAARPHAAPGR